MVNKLPTTPELRTVRVSDIVEYPTELGNRVSCAETSTGLFWRRKEIVVESEVIVEPNHENTRIWLMIGNADEILSPYSAGIRRLHTIYRAGCWRKHHMERVESTALIESYYRLF